MHDKPLYKLDFWWCFLTTKTHFLWDLGSAHAAYGPPALSQLSQRSCSLPFILCLWIGFPQTSSLYLLLDSLHHCCILNFHFPQHESQNYTFPNAQLLLNISSNLFYRYLKSRMSNINLTTFCFQLILLHIFNTSVNGTHCSSISCKMIFLLLIPNNTTRTNSVYLLNVSWIFLIFSNFTSCSGTLYHTLLLKTTIYWEFTLLYVNPRNYTFGRKKMISCFLLCSFFFCSSARQKSLLIWFSSQNITALLLTSICKYLETFRNN